MGVRSLVFGACGRGRGSRWRRSSPRRADRRSGMPGPFGCRRRLRMRNGGAFMRQHAAGEERMRWGGATGRRSCKGRVCAQQLRNGMFKGDRSRQECDDEGGERTAIVSLAILRIVFDCAGIRKFREGEAGCRGGRVTCQRVRPSDRDRSRGMGRAGKVRKHFPSLCSPTSSV